jgi:hypothetical protein
MEKGSLLLTVILSLALSSCLLVDFSEKDCVYRGVLSATCRWEHLTGEQTAPPYGQMQLLHHSLPSSGLAGFDAEVCHRSLAVGMYDLLVFNQGDNLIRGLEKPFTAEILAPVKEKDGKRYIGNEQAFVYSDRRENVPIHTDDTTHCTFAPRPLVQQITIHLLVKGMEALPGIELLSGELEGVTTSRRLASGEKGGGYAAKAFSFRPSAAGRERFSHTFLVLGINSSAENILRLQAAFEGGVEGETSVSLDEALDSFEADRIEITIEVDVSPALSLTALIAGWIEKDFGGIVIL